LFSYSLVDSRFSRRERGMNPLSLKKLTKENNNDR
jgi:hypothetical protein